MFHSQPIELFYLAVDIIIKEQMTTLVDKIDAKLQVSNSFKSVPGRSKQLSYLIFFNSFLYYSKNIHRTLYII